MKTLINDPLLSAAKIILLIAMGLMAVTGISALIGIPVVAIMHEQIGQSMAESGGYDSHVWVIVCLLVFAAVVMALGFLFTRHMKRIVDSVGLGDPFVPENATRLTNMAWLMLAIQIAIIPISALGYYLAASLDDDSAHIDASVDANALVLVLILFILARVFRKGTQMRDDLEGTV